MDPLSISSGVAGLVSLGLTVCKSLNTFCMDYRSRDTDIINLKNHAQRLDSFLQLVQTRLEASHQVDSALSESLKNCFGACQGCIQEFESLAKKQNRPLGPKGLKEYGKDAARHLQYPFQKAKFDRLKAEIEEFYTAMANYMLLVNQSEITAEALQAAVVSALKDLRCLFRNGRAWPSDLNDMDHTLLHRASNVHGHLWSDRALSIGAEVKGKSSVDGSNVLNLPDIYQSLSDYADGFDYGVLSCALIQKSEPALRRILAVSPSSMAERNNLGQTPLHVAAYWPRGLELLFELAEDACRHIIDAKDATKLTAIHSAIVLHQADSVEFLLKQGATIDLENTAIFFGHPEASDYYYQSQEVFDILSSELSSRRRKMLLFARENLAEKRLSEIGLQELNILQENAFKVLQVLKTIDVEIPSIFWTVRPGSTYHSPIMNAQLAEALYRAGFDRVNSIANGCNPLATINIAESSLRRDFGDLMGSVAWFERHGVDIKHPIPVFSRRLRLCGTLLPALS
ncbi:hypothetical protein CFIO01_08525 [Colletotrichum fioriniae PJ7]|uniref:Azaphilone pigments biosynthesis cluster protein L N-terminal domain-containing protein n=1 Tax=Colletotrichum fioriniae PJ7 TaxID=1445577 RepID=A0A010S6L1_9PEZI|nr:hypothetical protein CFIO01_08525 [Colletotrichum fioriniae PJ7]